MKTFLYNLAHTRAGDRGDVLNIGVIARRRELYPLIAAELPASRVKAFFGAWCRGEVLRYELPKLGALNFVLYGALDGGALASLRLDTQGRSYGYALLRLEIEVPDGLAFDRIV